MEVQQWLNSLLPVSAWWLPTPLHVTAQMSLLREPSLTHSSDFLEKPMLSFLTLLSIATGHFFYLFII